MKTYSIVPEYFLISEKAKTMVSNQNGLLVPMQNHESTTNGKWVSPEVAARHFKHGKGIRLKTMMDRIYAGKHMGNVKKDHLGNWWVFIPNYSDNQQSFKVA